MAEAGACRWAQWRVLLELRHGFLQRLEQQFNQFHTEADPNDHSQNRDIGGIAGHRVRRDLPTIGTKLIRYVEGREADIVLQLKAITGIAVPSLTISKGAISAISFDKRTAKSRSASMTWVYPARPRRRKL